jgi:hypothetical protein
MKQLPGSSESWVLMTVKRTPESGRLKKANCVARHVHTRMWCREALGRRPYMTMVNMCSAGNTVTCCGCNMEESCNSAKTLWASLTKCPHDGDGYSKSLWIALMTLK